MTTAAELREIAEAGPHHPEKWRAKLLAAADELEAAETVAKAAARVVEGWRVELDDDYQIIENNEQADRCDILERAVSAYNASQRRQVDGDE